MIDFRYIYSHSDRVALPLAPHTAVAPEPRISEDPQVTGYFYPREVAEILGVPEIDYAQLRRLFKLGREQSLAAVHDADRSWSRYTLLDVARAREALRLAGGKAALQRGRRLQLELVRKAVLRLNEAGICDPLLEVHLERQGSEIFATVEGTILNARNGQAILKDVYESVADQIGRRERDVLSRLRAERDRKLSQVRTDLELRRGLA